MASPSSFCSNINTEFKMKKTTHTSAKRGELLSFMATVAAVVLVSNIITMVAALYIPDNQVLRFQVMSRRQENDDEDLDRGASAPYQDQGDGQKATDGYEDNEPDGPYDETPRDEEGQADLERFFDDHLGASEKDGMDQENLPSNLRPYIVAAGRDLDLATAASNADFETTRFLPTYTGSASDPPSTYLDNSYLNNQNQQNSLPNVETSFIKLPNRKLIITRQITRGPVYKGGLDLSHVPSILKYHQDNDNFNDNNNVQQQQQSQKQENLDANGSDIVATENDDMDRVYVTNQTNKPFRIADLGGYDPEEDFQDASRDFEESERRKPNKKHHSESRRDTEDNSGNSNEQGHETQPTRDISFNDDADTLFNDASETDEVFFTHDPYQTDLEAELRGDQQPEKEKQKAEAATNEEETEPVQPEASDKPNEKVARKPNEDDSEGGWVNDGVEDMDVPSQSYQDEVLEKAAAAQEAAALAVKRAGDGLNDTASDDDQQPNSQQEQEQQQQQQQQQDANNNNNNSNNNENPQNQDPDNQRMPNADYLKEDMNVDDLNDVAR